VRQITEAIIRIKNTAAIQQTEGESLGREARRLDFDAGQMIDSLDTIGTKPNQLSTKDLARQAADLRKELQRNREETKRLEEEVNQVPSKALRVAPNVVRKPWESYLQRQRQRGFRHGQAQIQTAIDNRLF
jgi:hypothetical protein